MTTPERPIPPRPPNVNAQPRAAQPAEQPAPAAEEARPLPPLDQRSIADILDRLARPFHLQHIELKPGATTGDKSRALAPIEAEKQALRDQISQVLEHHGGTAQIAGFGKLEITAASVVTSYDKKQIEELTLDLTATHPEIAARLAACRVKGTRAGSLRITREKRPR